MTLAPQPPVLVPIEGDSSRKRLAEDHLTFIKVGFGYSLEILVRAGYETDGATIPTNIVDDWFYGKKIEEYILAKYPSITTHYDFENLVYYLIGTPWDMPRLLAALVHDVLYGRRWMLRWFCDRVYKRILAENGYDLGRAEIEYWGIRLVGWRNWNAVKDDEVEHTKRHSVVKLVKNRKISAEIERIRSKKS